MDDEHIQLVLSGEQLTLYEALFRRSERIARMYLGAQFALKDTVNPERFTLAAHAIRELMEKVPEIVAVATPAHFEKMRAKMGPLEDAFDRVIAQSNLKSPKWEGQTDGPTRQFLENAKAFFEWKRECMPKRKKEIASTMRALDGPGRALPPDLENLAVKQWQELQQYFLNIAHHQAPDPTLEEFDGHLRSLERFLLGKLNPPTFAEFDTIDAIIRSGESES